VKLNKDMKEHLLRLMLGRVRAKECADEPMNLLKVRELIAYNRARGITCTEWDRLESYINKALKIGKEDL
jgi:hypothetical protein